MTPGKEPAVNITSIPSDCAGARKGEPIPFGVARYHWPNRVSLACLCALVVAPLLACTAWAQNQPPVADAGGDKTVYTGRWVTLNGSAIDPEGDPIYSWYWEVVQMPTNGRYHLANEDTENLMLFGYIQGDYVVSLTVSDGISLGVGVDYATVHVADNLPPVAIATADVTNITVGGTVRFDGSQSYDPEGGPISYTWDFGDGNYLDGTNQTCHEYTNPDTYPVGLRVIDEGSANNFAYLTIHVFARPTVVASANPVSGPSSLPVQFDGSQTHADTDRSLASFLWYFGDETTSTNVSPTHQFAAGLHTVTLTVTDDLGGVGTNTLQILAGHGTNWPPVVDAGTNCWVATNIVTTLNGSATDPDNQPIVTWQWVVVSAPSSAQYTLADPANPHSDFSAQTVGTYVLSLTASDGTDWSFPGTVTVWVGIQMPPVADAGPDTKAYVDVPITLQGSALDPNGDPIYSWSWEVEQAPAPSSWTLTGGGTPTPRFTGHMLGDYLLGLVVSDGISINVGQDHTTIHVTPPPLRVGLSNPDTLLLAWPAAVTNYVLEQNADLTATNWTTVTNTAVLAGDEKQVILSPTSARNFFRLHRP